MWLYLSAWYQPLTGKTERDAGNSAVQPADNWRDKTSSAVSGREQGAHWLEATVSADQYGRTTVRPQVKWHCSQCTESYFTSQADGYNCVGLLQICWISSVKDGHSGMPRQWRTFRYASSMTDIQVCLVNDGHSGMPRQRWTFRYASSMTDIQVCLVNDGHSGVPRQWRTFRCASSKTDIQVCLVNDGHSGMPRQWRTFRYASSMTDIQVCLVNDGHSGVPWWLWFLVLFHWLFY